MFHGTLNVGTRTAMWWFTDRRNGASVGPFAQRNLAGHVGDDPVAVRGNREALQDELGLGPISWMGPVHGVDIAMLERPSAITPNVDALATLKSAMPLATLGADCVPLLLAAGDVVIAAHVGWRGLASGMTRALSAQLAAWGTTPEVAQVLLGPSICGACYGIPDERAEIIHASCPAALTRARNGHPGADIRRGLSAEWEALGARVQCIGGCTAEGEAFFSHRRDGITGRQAGVIAWMH